MPQDQNNDSPIVVNSISSTPSFNNEKRTLDVAFPSSPPSSPTHPKYRRKMDFSPSPNSKVLRRTDTFRSLDSVFAMRVDGVKSKSGGISSITSSTTAAADTENKDRPPLSYKRTLTYQRDQRDKKRASYAIFETESADAPCSPDSATLSKAGPIIVAGEGVAAPTPGPSAPLTSTRTNALKRSTTFSSLSSAFSIPTPSTSSSPPTSTSTSSSLAQSLASITGFSSLKSVKQNTTTTTSLKTDNSHVHPLPRTTLPPRRLSPLVPPSYRPNDKLKAYNSGTRTQWQSSRPPASIYSPAWSRTVRLRSPDLEADEQERAEASGYLIVWSGSLKLEGPTAPNKLVLRPSSSLTLTTTAPGTARARKDASPWGPSEHLRAALERDWVRFGDGWERWEQRGTEWTRVLGRLPTTTWDGTLGNEYDPDGRRGLGLICAALGRGVVDPVLQDGDEDEEDVVFEMDWDSPLEMASKRRHGPGASGAGRGTAGFGFGLGRGAGAMSHSSLSSNSSIGMGGGGLSRTRSVADFGNFLTSSIRTSASPSTSQGSRSGVNIGSGYGFGFGIVLDANTLAQPTGTDLAGQQHSSSITDSAFEFGLELERDASNALSESWEVVQREDAFLW